MAKTPQPIIPIEQIIKDLPKIARLDKPMDYMEFITRLLSVHNPSAGLNVAIKDYEILRLLEDAKKIFMEQEPMIEIDAPVRICGDTHGQFSDLLRLFQKGGFPPVSNYLFLGDYVDRGKQNLETIILLFAYKVKYPTSFFLLRGNHECSTINKVYGFLDECQRRYQKTGTTMWHYFQDTFQFMPLTACVSERILCMHGGLSDKLTDLDMLRKVSRPYDPCSDCLEMDCLWADPVVNLKGFAANPRGASVGFGADVVKDFCKKTGLDLIARAHQVVQDGYEFFADRKLVTVFSAPHYCGQFDNAAAILVVDKNLRCTFEILKPCPKSTPIQIVELGKPLVREPNPLDPTPAQ